MRGIIKLAGSYILWCIGCLALVTGLHAQTVFGSLAGTVTDPSGASVGGAKVHVAGVGSGTKLDFTTSSSGAFRFSELPIGAYNVTVTAPGFQTGQFNGIQINLQVTTSLVATLKVGTTTETVTVNESALSLQTETSDITGSITDQQYNDLPLALGGVGALRSPEAFIFLLPGNTGPGTANSNNGIFFAKIAGGQDYGSEVLIDGLSQQRSENGSSFDEEAPSVDALRELTVTDAVPPAEYNRTTGGFENFATKSGTNAYHGQVYDLFRNTALDANLWFNGGNGAQACSGTNDTPACLKGFSTPVDRKNDYGVTFGGPVRIPKLYNGRDKLFFFFAWENLKYTVGANVTSTVPTTAELGGDFSSPSILIPGTNEGTDPCDGSIIQQGEIFDPATQRTVQTATGPVTCRTAFPGNKIPMSRFSPAAVKLLSYYPTVSNPNDVVSNYQFSSQSPIQNTTMTIRIDSNITQNHHVWSSYSSRDNNRISGTPQVLPYPIDPSTWRQNFTTHFWRAGWDWTIRPNLLNNLIIGTNRSNSANFAIPIAAGVNYFQQFGIGNANSLNFPAISNGILTNEGNAPQNDQNIDNGVRVVESITWQKGKHSLTFGTDDRYQQYSPLNNNSPNITFGTGQTEAFLGSSGNGNGLASELLGLANGGGQNIYAHQSRWISWYYSGYAQDDWKVTPQLTFNLGVNYSIDRPRHEADNYTSEFSPTAVDPEYGVPGALVFGTQCVSQGCNTAWVDTYKKDIAPRLGFAYSPNFLHNTTAIRGGFGILYGPLQYDDFGGSMNTGYKSNPSFNSPDGFNPAFVIDNGYPAFTPPPDLDPGFFNGQPVSGSYIEPGASRPAEVYNWDANIQQQLSKGFIFSIGYVGSAAQNLQANNQNINNIPLSALNLGFHLNDNVQGNADGVTAPFAGFYNLWGNGVQVQRALRPFPQYDYIDTGCCIQATGHSSYDALLVSLKGQLKDLTLQASYTWQKNENDTDSALPNTNPGQPQVQNPDDLRQEKAISIQDLPNTFVLSYIYALPFGKGEHFLNHGFASYFAGGWKVGGIQRYQSGAPLAFCCAAGIPGFQNAIRYNLTGASVISPVYKSGWRKINPFAGANGKGETDPQVNSFFVGSQTNQNCGASARQPNCSGTYGTEGIAPAFFDQVQYVNELASPPPGVAPVYLPFTLGNTPRVTGIRMPIWANEDFSIIKNTPLREGVQLGLKFELLDAFNRHYFNTPDTNPADQNFGIPTSTANGPRNIQVTANINF